jgi:hypothetical protein
MFGDAKSGWTWKYCIGNETPKQRRKLHVTFKDNTGIPLADYRFSRGDE